MTEFLLLVAIVFILAQILQISVEIQMLILLWGILIFSMLCTVFFIWSLILLLLSKKETAQFLEVIQEGEHKFYRAMYEYKGNKIKCLYPTDGILRSFYKTGEKKYRLVYLFKQFWVLDGFAMTTIMLGLPLFAGITIIIGKYLI